MGTMTKEEMNKFLESIGGLENGFFTGRPPITDSGFFSVGLGWYPIIKDLIEDLIKLGWDKQLCQVKEKFGGLRYYFASSDPSLYKQMGQIIAKYERESFGICEVCGKTGTTENTGGMIKTLCKSDRKIRKS